MIQSLTFLGESRPHHALLIEQVPGSPGRFRRLGITAMYSSKYPNQCLVDVGEKRVF